MSSRGQWLLMLLISSRLADLSKSAFMIYALVGLWPTTRASVADVSVTPPTSSHGSGCPWRSSDGILCRCPSGHFWNQTACAACRKCEGATYQICACHESHDSICLHVVLPLLMGITELGKTFEEGFFRQLTLSRRRKRARVEASSNVFMENLHSMKNLVTVFYVTNINQLTDFVWFRDSGIRVNVGLQNINLMPVYEDVSHHGDNNFMLQNPNSDQEAKYFTNILEQHCRNPMPDYYNVTLEIYRERITKASLEECTLASQGLCPADTGIGNYFLRRSLNEPCSKLEEYRPELMTQAANSIVCGESNSLLQQLFKVPASDVHSIKFSSSVCQESASKCNQCLERNYCHPTEEDSEFRCCHSDCFLLPDCKRHYSLECRNVPVECATGDAYRYTLIPVYSHLKTQFHCHIRKRPPSILYRLWFYLTIPANGSIIETPKLCSEVFASDVENRNQGVKVIEFLTIEQRVGLPLDNNLIISGHGLSKDATNYTIESLKHNHPMLEMKPERIQDNVLTLSTQFEEPFAYSTSNWVDNNNNCAKNISKFYPVVVGAQGQMVNVITKATGTSFQYTVMSSESAPQLRFSLPGNVSILSWWFRGNPSTILFDNTFRANLSLTDDAKTWGINFSGSLSKCPGYFKVTINDHSELEEVAKYDLLVSCPVNFSISFYFPNVGAKLEKTFEIILNDLSKEHRVFLTKLSHTCRAFETNGHASQSILSTGLVAETKFFGSTCILIVVTFMVAFVLFCVLVDLLCNISSGLSRWHKTRETSVATLSHRCCVSATVSYKAIICFYILLKLLYSLLFTFTTFSILFVLLQRDRLLMLMNFKGNPLQNFEDMPQIAVVVERQMNHVLDDQMLYKFHIQEACNEYLEEIFTRLRTTDFKSGKLNFSQEENSLTVLFRDFAKLKYEQIQNLVKTVCEPFLENLHRNIHLVIKRFQNQLTGAFRNPWLMYVRNLFAKSTYRSQSNISVATNHKTDLPAQLVDFANFLEIYDLEVIHFWQPRFSKWLKAIFDVSFLSSNHSHNLKVIQCSQQNLQFPNDSTDWQKMNSTRYFVSYGDALPSIDWQHANFKNLQAQKESSAVMYRQTPYNVILNTSNPEFFWRTYDRSSFGSELDLSPLQMPNIELFLVVLVLDAVLLLYKVTVLCTEIKGFHSGERQVDFLHERQGANFQQGFLTKKKEKVVCFAGLEQSSDEGTKSFHSLQDLYSEVKMTNANVYTNSFRSVRGCQKMGSILVMPPKSNISRQENVNSKLPNVLITLNSLKIPYHIVAASGDSEVASSQYCSMSLRSDSYFQLFWQLSRCSNAFPRAVMAGILFLLSGMALNVFGQNLMPEFLQSFLELRPYKKVLNDSIHSFNRYLQQLTRDSNKELLRWQRDMMTFEIKQLQGIFEFLNAGRISQMETSTSYVCSVRLLLGLSGGACHNSSAHIKPIPTPILPCNFLEIEPHSLPETLLHSMQQNISINLINEFQNVCDLVTSLSIMLCLVVVFSFIFHVAISAFFRALKMQNFVPVRIFIVAKKGQNFMTTSRSCHTSSSPLSENKTQPTTSPMVVRTESSDRSGGGADDSDYTIICSHVDVASGASTSSSNLHLSASLRKFSETKV